MNMFWLLKFIHLVLNVYMLRITDSLDLLLLLAQDRFLAYSPDQHPIVLQIGGSNLENLEKATELANPYHYDEINFKFVPFLYRIS